MSIKKTFKELREIDIIVGNMYRMNPNLPNSRFGYAYKKFATKNFYPFSEEYNDELNFLRIDHALADKVTGALLPENTERGFRYDKEGLKSVMLAEKALNDRWNAKIIDVEPYISREIPENLSEEAKVLFQGLIINLPDASSEKEGA